jgi:gamma-glutamyl hydrolase
MILEKSSHTGRTVTDEPIIGVLVQPFNIKEESARRISNKLDNTYVKASDVSFLEAAGARVVPINYRLHPQALGEMLEQVNGVYIPGDSASNLDNEKYMAAVLTILTWA